jgi:putative ATP-binding cassette transporter
MNLLKFINYESDAPKNLILAMAMLSGVASSLILAIINQAAEYVDLGIEVETYFFFMYLTALMIFIKAGRYSYSQAIIAIEAVIAKVRIRIADKIRRSELRFIEDKGDEKIYSHLTQDTTFISQSAFVLVGAAQSSIILIFCFFYLAWLSLFGFLLIIFLLVFVLMIYFFYHQSISEKLRATRKKETAFFESLNHVLAGFKEIKINQKKNDDLFKHIKTIFHETKQLKISLGHKFVIEIIFSQISTYFTLGIIVFILPLLSSIHAEEIIKISITLLFIAGPIDTIVSAMPMLARANIAVENIQQLEAELDAINEQTVFANQVSEKQFFDFKTIQLNEVQFQYQDKQDNPLFHVGPLNITIEKGEILFIVGGNGSGKSTVLKLLTGLYYPYTGTINVDEKVIEQNNYQAYRELFAIIFTDFHLFDKLYGLPIVDEKQLNALLHAMDLEKKTQYLDGKFTNTDLSTGQKKRLAFISAVLENKPIYILDELAADQDPHFRKYFYEEVLPDLKKQGKTIIAVTHDDKYFDLADRVLKMDYGKITDL